MRHAAHTGNASQRGMALIAALFMVIVVAALGTFSLRIGSTQRHAATLALLTYRANAAANSGLEFGALRASQGVGVCALNNPPLAVAGFVVNVRCRSTTHTVAGNTHSVFNLEATAVAGVYGRPEFVQRTLRRRVSNIPPGTW